MGKGGNRCVKKFVFTNERYMRIKTNEYDTLKLTMQNVDRNIVAVKADISVLLKKAEEERVSYNRACRNGTTVDKLVAYGEFFPYLMDQIQTKKRELLKLEERKNQIKKALLKAHNDLKVLENMKDEQYAAYLKEVAADEAKELDSFMSFNIYKGAEQ